jgi:hypothetical protein
MIGTKLQRPDGGEFVISGQAGSGWVVSRVDQFEGPREMSTAAIAAEFSADLAPAADADEQAGWKALAQANRHASNLQALVSGDLHPFDDQNVTPLADQNDATGNTRPADIQAEDEGAVDDYVARLRLLRKQLLGREESPEEVFARREAEDAQAAAPKPRRSRAKAKPEESTMPYNASRLGPSGK